MNQYNKFIFKKTAPNIMVQVLSYMGTGANLKMCHKKGEVAVANHYIMQHCYFCYLLMWGNIQRRHDSEYKSLLTQKFGLITQKTTVPSAVKVKR